MSTTRSRRTCSVVLSAAPAIAALALLGGLAGCASKRSATTSASSAVPVHVEPSAQVELREPSAAWDAAAGVLRVDGVVRRQPGYDGPVAGHMHVDLLSPEQELLDQVLLEWMPSNVPLDGQRQAAYRLRYRPAEKLPPGSTLRLAVVDDAFAHAFPAPEQSGGGARRGGGSGVRGGPKIQTPRPLGTPWAPARRTTPAPRQQSSTPATPSGIPGSRGGKR